jgi:hypothetical protein
MKIHHAINLCKFISLPWLLDTPDFYKINFNIILSSVPIFYNLSSLDFLTKILCVDLAAAIHAACIIHLAHLFFCTIILFGYNFKLTNFNSSSSPSFSSSSSSSLLLTFLICVWHFSLTCCSHLYLCLYLGYLPFSILFRTFFEIVSSLIFKTYRYHLILLFINFSSNVYIYMHF